MPSDVALHMYVKTACKCCLRHYVCNFDVILERSHVITRGRINIYITDMQKSRTNSQWEHKGYETGEEKERNLKVYEG